MGAMKDKVKGGLNEAAGKLKQQSADPDTRRKGAGQELKGKAQQLKGKVKDAIDDV